MRIEATLRFSKILYIQVTRTTKKSRRLHQEPPFVVYMEFRDYVSGNYQRIKLLVQRNCWNRSTTFSEDIFHDVLMNCLEAIDHEMTESEYRGYILRSYNNLLINSARKNSRVELRESTVDEPEYNDPCSQIDLQLIYNDLEEVFGLRGVELFKMWLRGYSVREIEESTGEYGLTYLFKKMKARISSTRALYD